MLVVILQDISICTIHIYLLLGTQNCSIGVPLLKLQPKKINEQNYQRILSTMEGYTKWICHMGRGEYFVESRSEISWGQAILGGEGCNVPIQIIAQQETSINPTSSLGWVETLGS